jgi:hypothetical protein
VHHTATIAQLKELLVALDSRQVQPGRTAEAGIARDALELRRRAVARLAELHPDTSVTGS